MNQHSFSRGNSFRPREVRPCREAHDSESPPGSRPPSVLSSLMDSASVSTRHVRQSIQNLQVEFDQTPRTLRDEADFIDTCAEHFNKPELSDIVLQVGDKRFYSHKFILAKSSDVFKVMLFDKRFDKSEQQEEGADCNVLDLSESSECQLVFDRFLRFLYTADIEIDCESAVGILCLADKYNTRALKRLTVEYMAEMTKSPQNDVSKRLNHVSTALAWYPWAKALNLGPLLEQCQRTIAWSFQDFIHSEEFLSVDREFLVDMLQSSELVVRNEYVLYEAVHSWLTDAAHVECLEEHAAQLLPLIRFPQMLVDQVFNIETSEIASNGACRDLIKDLLGKAYRFRAICQSQPGLSSHFSEDCFFIPREYTELIVDVVKIQNTLRFGIQVDVKMYVGPAPSESRDGDWKITYRKNGDIWNVQIFPHESSLVQGEARIMACAIIYNQSEKVVNVSRTEPCVASRGQNISFQVELPDDDLARSMAIVLKPLP